MHFFGKSCATFCQIMHQKSRIMHELRNIVQFFLAKIIIISLSLGLIRGSLLTSKN